MAKLRKKKATASSAEDVTAIEVQTAAMVEETEAIEADIDAKLKAAYRNAQAEAETQTLEKEAQVNNDPLSALVPAPQAPPVEIIFQETPAVNGELASDEASSDLQKFEALDAEIYADIDDWADRLRALKQEFRDRILPKIYVMWEFLSERGSMHFAGSLLPKWGDWRDRCIATLRKKMNMSKSTLERELKLFRDEQDGNADIVDKNDIDSSNGQQTEDFAPVEERDPVSLLKEHCKQVNDALSGTSIKSEDERIARVAELNENLALAINDGLLDGPDKTEPTAAAEKAYKLLAPMLYNYYLLGVQVRWWDAEKAYKITGEEVPDDVRVAYYENFIVRNRKYAPYPEILNVPWPNLKVDNSLEVSTRLAKGYGPPMWFCIEEPNGDTVECLIDRAGSGKCTRVRRTKQDSPATTDDNSMETQVLCEAPSAIENVPESEETEQALVPDDDIDHELVPLSELAKRLRGVSYELDYHCLDGFRDDIDAIADRIEDREELDKRMVNFEKRMSRSPNGVSARWLYKQIRRDRRFANEMNNILRDGGTTYRGQKILGTKDEPYIWRYTRDEVKAELKGDRPNQLGKPSVWRPTPREMMLAVQENQDETALEHITEEQPEVVAVSELEPESMGHQEATALVTIEPAPESIGLPGCTYIYAPAGQANEFAALAANPYKGCGHGCTYCFNTTRKNKKQKATFHDGAVPRKDYLALLLKDAKKYQAAGITEQVTLCFSTDAYNPFDTSLTRPTLEIIQQHGMGICVLTKGGTRALTDIDLYRPDRDCFASTLTGLDEALVSKWEPNAASPDDRIAALKAFNKKGIFTWVSLEPTLNVGASLGIVKATHGFVNLYKIGKVNYCKEISDTIDWRDYTLRMIDLCQRLGVKHYIKRDLQPYLPAGYSNPMRVAQHF